MGYIRTYSGIYFDPVFPDEKYIKLEDIAHSLSLLCRANGHFPEFFSVARHSLNCASEAKARELSIRVQLACLLHDAGEAYVSDVTRPIKAELPEYRTIEDRMHDMILRKFGVSDLHARELSMINEIDDAMMYHEFLHFTGDRIFQKEPRLFRKPNYTSLPFKDTESEFLTAAGHLIIQVKLGKGDLV